MKNWLVTALIGALFLVGGCLSVAYPLPATLAAGGLIAWTFLVIGILVVLTSWQSETWMERVLLLALGIVTTVIGWALISNPLAGILQLTFVIAILFVASGLAKIIASFWYRSQVSFWYILFSGVASVAIGALALANFPQSAAVMLGLMLSVELFSDGIAFIAMASVQKQFGRESST